MSGSGIVLSHGAGGNAEAPLLRKVDAEFTKLGLTVVRHTLYYRQQRPKGPPRPHEAAKDRESIQTAIAELRGRVDRVFAGGHSYGGRQTSILAAEEPNLCAGLLLFSYPLHPPGKPDQLRTAHLDKLQGPVLFVHGTRDPFGSIGEMQRAVKLIRGPAEIFVADGAGHDLKGVDVTAVCSRFLEMA